MARVKARFVTATIVHTRRLGKIVLKHFFKTCPLDTSILKEQHINRLKSVVNMCVVGRNMKERSVLVH
jgi:hypothetical protein